ncbi:MAG: hypothetical protein IID28_13120 [Planctomycetes bacterium]|nr:hypothetical protein [Planctomycetota bacterium]
MRCLLINDKAVLICAGVLLTMVPAGTSQASFAIGAGWDLFETTTPTTFMGFEFTGVPLGSFSFGLGPTGRDTGTADTIIERLEAASVPGAGMSDTVDIELVALHLVSVEPIDLGGGLDFYFITLQQDLASLGQMIIEFVDELGGLFSSLIDLAFDVRIGSLDGAIIFSDILQITTSDVPWDHVAPSGALQLDGINRNLNGVDTSADFWPDPFTLGGPNGLFHSVHSATPAPPGLAVLALAALAARRRHRSAPNAHVEPVTSRV